VSLRSLLMLFALAAAASPALAQAVGGVRQDVNIQQQSDKVGITEKIGNTVALDLVFRDENDQPIALGDCVAGKPTILVMAYYRCTVLCTSVNEGLVKSMRELPPDFSAGTQYRVVTVSMDPKEKGDLARRRKELSIKEYGRPGAEEGWRFLTGTKEAVAQLTDAIGYRYEFDKVFKEYNHPSGIVLLSPQGKVTRYFYGIDFGGEKRLEGGEPTTLRLSLIEAADGKGGSLMDKLMLACYSWNPHNKKYTPTVRGMMKIAGAVTILALGLGVGLALLRDRRRRGHVPTLAAATETQAAGPPEGVK
jgi:protein SCO1/2